MDEHSGDSRREACNGLNQMMTGLFHEILEIEEQAVKHAAQNQLTMTEIHTLVAIGAGEGRMSEVASRLGVTVSTLTTAIKKLESKGFVERRRDGVDRRIVHISRTERGERICASHDRFHRRMTQAAVEGLGEEEVQILTDAIGKLQEFFYHEKERHANRETKAPKAPGPGR